MDFVKVYSPERKQKAAKQAIPALEGSGYTACQVVRQPSEIQKYNKFN